MTKFKIGNTAASKPLDQHQAARVVLAVTPAEKAWLDKVAYPKTIASYIRPRIFKDMDRQLKKAVTDSN